MLSGHMKEVPEEQSTVPCSQGATIRWLIGPTQGASTFFTRYINIKKGGIIPLHTHPQEHQQYVVTGRGVAFTEDKRMEIRPGSFVYVRGGEKHGLQNTGDEDLGIICCVDNLPKK